MPFTPSGFTPFRYTEIVENVRTALETELGTSISSDPNTVMGTIIGVFSTQIAEQENLNQAQFNNLDADRAEGVFLDRIVAYLGLNRLPASSSSGQLKVWRSLTGNIASSTTFATGDNTQYSSVNGLSHNLSACNEVYITPSSIIDNTEYSITINGGTYRYTTGTNDTALAIITALKTQLDSLTTFTSTITGDNLRIADADANQNSLNVSYVRFSLIEIATFNFVESVLTGRITTDPNTITTAVSPDNTILRSNNPLVFASGRTVETDEELRARLQTSRQIAGVATVPAITAALGALTGVYSASIIENRTTVPDSDGRPAKSYECIVEGGNPNQIANTIWETKPAGVETFGSITTTITDSTGNTQVINWSRPTAIYLHVRVTFTRYDEETFPSGGIETIRDTVVTYGNGLGLGVDVIPSRFIGEIHRAVQGIDSLLVEVGTSSDPSAPAPDTWQTTSIAIARNNFSSFVSGRVTVIDNT